ncbi:four helix bundle protein [Weeksellaceae bacterium KMM 9713]|uniref:Four helix bundle protein n=1 Tax=Profundicola chukchiensis TaxID=2961959 RepID=A0A9X4RV58_9FLAO|nr:four helix bundle protein [Profundicola chukchiensis]MDG4945435.1 four helix bundle protein [Profundicola chukchiensis]MDG4950515.1 four helix bundle protein [Profundicola chukchiensis]
MSKIKHFEDLETWQLARELSLSIYRLTKTFPNEFELVSQMRRSALSVMDNIAEGFERGGKTEYIQFLYLAKGSCGELRSQLYSALDREHLSQEDFEQYRKRCIKISVKLSNMITQLKNSPHSGDKFK